MQKRGQTVFGLSFGAIFSIIIIIAIIGVSLYAILTFFSFGSCSEIGLYYDDLQARIDEAWTSEIVSGEFTGRLPSGIEYLCIGNLSTGIDPTYSEIRSEIEFDYSGDGRANIFIYPTEKACDGELASNVLEHVKINQFTCISPSDGEFTLSLQKSRTDSLVNLGF